MIGTGNLNWHRAICTARAVVRNQGRGLSRAAPQRFTSKMRNPDETPALFFGKPEDRLRCSCVSALQACRIFGAERTWAGFLTMSAIGTKRTCRPARMMSALVGKTDIPPDATAATFMTSYPNKTTPVSE
jgi:hypothetical protein